jgi:hypothetical protein
MVQSISDVVQVAGAKMARSTLQGIQVASAQSGVSFQYLLAKAAQESSFQTDAAAKTSSASGLFQFTRGTWLEVFKRHGQDLGYGELSARILNGPAGRITVFDKATEQQILDLREDPKAAALMAAAYARDNAASLQQSLPREVSASDLYLAHFLGPKGAGQLLEAEASAPNIYASHLVPAAARANPAVFFTDTGAPRTVRAVLAFITERFGAQLDRFAEVDGVLAQQDNALAIGADLGRPFGGHEAAVAADARPRTREGGAPQASAGDPGQMTLSWFVMQELARLIASSPMMMADEGEDQASASTAISSGGFAGTDWSEALANSFARGQSPSAAPVSAGHAARAYGGGTRR